jgi:hypothetical protein
MNSLGSNSMHHHQSSDLICNIPATTTPNYTRDDSQNFHNQNNESTIPGDTTDYLDTTGNSFQNAALQQSLGALPP